MNARTYGRTYGPVRTTSPHRARMIGVLAECSSLPCGELFSATTDIAHDSDIPTITNTLLILNIAVAYKSNRAKVTFVQAWRFARIRYRASENYFKTNLVDCGECARVVHATMYIGPLDTGDVRRLAGGWMRSRTDRNPQYIPDPRGAEGVRACVDRPRGTTAAGQLLPRILGCQRTARKYVRRLREGV